MAHLNEINVINFNNFPIINNEREELWNVGWVIDRTPDFNLINNINNEFHDINFINNLQNIRNQNFNQQFTQATHALMNGLIEFNTNNEDIDDYDEPLNNEDDFIPFEPLPIYHPVIETEVHQIPVLEQERDCPICYETREYEDISQTNCGHKFCGFCLTEHIRTTRIQPHCPLCRDNITHITFQTHHHNATFLEI